MLFADLSDTREFVSRPHAACRVLRIAEEKGAGLFSGSTFFEILEIDFPAAVHELQRVFAQHKARIPD